jgi:hypothetical protein
MPVTTTEPRPVKRDMTAAWEGRRRSAAKAREKAAADMLRAAGWTLTPPTRS